MKGQGEFNLTSTELSAITWALKTCITAADSFEGNKEEVLSLLNDMKTARNKLEHLMAEAERYFRKPH